MKSVAKPEDVQYYLMKAQFPASREDLISYAKNAGAPNEVVNTISLLPNQGYNTLEDVIYYAGKL